MPFYSQLEFTRELSIPALASRGSADSRGYQQLPNLTSGRNDKSAVRTRYNKRVEEVMRV